MFLIRNPLRLPLNFVVNSFSKHTLRSCLRAPTLWLRRAIIFTPFEAWRTKRAEWIISLLRTGSAHRRVRKNGTNQTECKGREKIWGSFHIWIQFMCLGIKEKIQKKWVARLIHSSNGEVGLHADDLKIWWVGFSSDPPNRKKWSLINETQNRFLPSALSLPIQSSTKATVGA